MRYRYTTRSPGAGGSTARTLAAILLALVAVVLLLDLGDSPWLANLLAGLGRQRLLVGIIAGHWQSDSGAVCPDGLKEVDLNLAIARRVADRLRAAGYRAEVLPEFSPKLDGYRAAAFLSIHNDSCVALSGFKVARLTHATDPDQEDQLVQALYSAYAAATGLEPHYNTITDDMREYHAFRRIAPETPGAIIECGFMGGDRHLLTQQQDDVATGIADGLIAFLHTIVPEATAAP